MPRGGKGMPGMGGGGKAPGANPGGRGKPGGGGKPGGRDMLQGKTVSKARRGRGTEGEKRTPGEAWGSREGRAFQQEEEGDRGNQGEAGSCEEEEEDHPEALRSREEERPPVPK